MSKSTLLFILLALSLTAANAFKTSLRTQASLTLSEDDDDDSDSFDANDGADVVSACYSGFMNNIPPTFCYKSGGDAGKIPTQCASGLFRYGALCYDNCKDGYEFVLGVCWEKCTGAYHSEGAICYKNIFHWHFKDSYVDKSYTNFQSESICDDNYYKSGALCYRDCNKISLLNCGIGACAATSTICGATIAEMAFNELLSIAKGVLFVASFGASSEDAEGEAEAKATVDEGFDKLGSGSVNEALAAFKDVIAREGTTAFYKQVATWVADNIAKFTAKSIALGTITTICDEVSAKLMDKVQSSSTASLNYQSFDLTGISTAITGCSSTSTESDKITCAADVLNAINFVDPTGLTGMAAAVMQPTCSGV